MQNIPYYFVVRDTLKLNKNFIDASFDKKMCLIITNLKRIHDSVTENVQEATNRARMGFTCLNH